MASLQTILSRRLEGLRSNPDGTWQARCPCCAVANRDTTKNHLRVWRSGAFQCVVHQGDTEHNKAIRAYLYAGADAQYLTEVVIVDPEPKVETDPVYPEDMLAKLVPDYTYWLGRKIAEDVLIRLEGGLAPADERSKLSGRFIFPVRHHVTKRIMGFSGRLVSEASFGPKWKHLVKSSKCVYPLTATGDAIKRARRVVLLESVGDMLACMTAGIDCVLVLFGLNLNSHVLGYLVSANLDQVVISTNNDAVDPSKGHEVGNEAARKLQSKLAMYLGADKVSIRLPVTAKDWGDVLERGTGELEVFKGELGL